MKYLIGNWKSNFTPKEVQYWIDQVDLNIEISPNIEVVLCPGFIHLYAFSSKDMSFKIGSQYLSPFPNGAYTGAVSASMLKGVVSYAILGHSERRRYFGESSSAVVNQIDQSLESGITPIIAIDRDNWHTQLSLINQSSLKKCLVMYEPPEAISTQKDGKGVGQAASIDDVVNHIKKIRQDFSPKAVIYGGSITSHNIAEFLSKPEIEGVLPGSASLNPIEWVKMIQLANQSIS